MLLRGRLLRLEGASAGVETAFRGFGGPDDTLAVSPMLVGGVEEEEGAFDVSTVMTLLIESEDDARVASSLLGALGDAPSLSKRGENIVSRSCVICFRGDVVRCRGKDALNDEVG
jgi:hypothetical protein